MIRNFLKFSVLVEVEPVTDENGKGVWRAKSPSLKMTADADTPTGAMEKLKEQLQAAENSALAATKESKVVKREELKTEVEKEEESVKELAPVDLKALGKTALKEYALKKGLVVTGGMSKQEVIKLILGEEVDRDEVDGFDEEESGDN